MSKGTKEKTDKITDNPSASKNTATPNKNPRIKNKIFMAINHIKPSKFQLKISPGKRMDHEDTSIKTSLTYEAVKMQYIVETNVYPIMRGAQMVQTIPTLS